MRIGNKQYKIKPKALVVIFSLIVSTLTFVSVNAASINFVMSANIQKVKRGESVTITVATQDLHLLSGGFNGYSGGLNYDTAVLSRKSTETSVVGWNFVYNPSANTFLGSDPTGMDFKKQDLDVFTIQFEALADAPLGLTSITLSDLAISDSAYKNIKLNGAVVTIEIIGNDEPTPPTQSSNNNLSGLTTSTGTLSPTFSPGVTGYSMTVDHGVSSISLSPQLADSKAKILSGGGSHSLTEGTNTIEVVVEAENGSRKTYTIVVTRSAKNDGNGNNDNQNGDTNGNQNGDSDNNGDSSGNGSNDGGSGSGSGLGEGGSSQSGSNNQNQNQSSNNFVINIQGMGQMDKEFSPNIYYYKTYVGLEVDELNPLVFLEDSKAHYVILGSSNLQVGNNTVKLVVTAENGEAKEYIFDVIKSEQQNTATLASLIVGGYAINPGFRPDINYYSLRVPAEVSTLAVSAAPQHGGAMINIIGNNKLSYGVNYIKVTVDSGYMQNTYMVEVIREASNQSNMIMWIIMIVVLILSWILLLLSFLKNKINKVKEEERRKYQNQLNPPPQIIEVEK